MLYYSFKMYHENACCFSQNANKTCFSHDVASGSDIMLCNIINKTLVVYRFVTIRNDDH